MTARDLARLRVACLRATRAHAVCAQAVYVDVDNEDLDVYAHLEALDAVEDERYRRMAEDVAREAEWEN